MLPQHEPIRLDGLNEFIASVQANATARLSANAVAWLEQMLLSGSHLMQ